MAASSFTPDFTGQDLFSPFFDVELPACRGFDHRDGKLPAAVSDNQMRRISLDNRGMTDVPVAQEAIDSIRSTLQGQKIAPVLSEQVGHRALVFAH